MNKKFRIRKNQEFQEIISKKNIISTKNYILYFTNKKFEYSRLGISIGKKLGNAVERNLYKRQLRMIISEIFDFYTFSFDMVIIIRNNFTKTSYQENKNILENVLKKVKIK